MRTWYAAGIVVAVALAWIAAKLHVLFAAPFGSLAVGFGLMLGVALGVLAAKKDVRFGRGLFTGAVLLAIVAVIAQHAWLYVEFRRQWHEARVRSPEVAMFRPEDPWPPDEYFRREVASGSAPLWCIDAGLIVGMAVGVFWLLERKRRQFGLAADAKTNVPPDLNPEP